MGFLLGVAGLVRVFEPIDGGPKACDLRLQGEDLLVVVLFLLCDDFVDSVLEVALEVDVRELEVGSLFLVDFFENVTKGRRRSW
jgi:hypothetical protein